MKIERRILMGVRRRKGAILLRKDAASFGSRTAVSRALYSLVRRGKLVRLGYGVYAKTRRSIISDAFIPDGTLAELAFEALTRLGAELSRGRSVPEYNAGLTTQIPAKVIFNTNGKRVTRSLRIGTKSVSYELTRPTAQI